MIIDGKKIADKILGELKDKVAKIEKPPYLAAVLVGPVRNSPPLGPSGRASAGAISNGVENDAGSRKFLELKKKAAESIGIECRIYEFPGEISNSELRKRLNQIVKATTCGGMIIELPLPTHLNTQAILNVVPEEKDPDVLSQKAQGAFWAGRSKVLPPSAEAVKIILEEYKIEPKGKVAAVFGYGLLVGKPISHWLASQGATIMVINEFTENPAELSGKADIVISGAGKPGLVKSEMVKEGAIVIDFGYTAEAQNITGSTEKKIMGDIDFKEVSKKASFITPVPGGTGPIVVAAVLKNFIELVDKKDGKLIGELTGELAGKLTGFEGP
jgi:methylenetetrahydrofolate dehydrogenase (NADP+)/methenyltetrahydrofolate cyclohydrolase